MHLDIFVILRRQTPAASSSSFLSVEPWAALFIFVLWPGPRRREITVGELWYSPNEFHRWIISFFFPLSPSRRSVMKYMSATCRQIFFLWMKRWPFQPISVHLNFISMKMFDSLRVYFGFSSFRSFGHAAATVWIKQWRLLDSHT